MALLELVFVILKTGIYAFIYALLISLILNVLHYFINKSWLEKILKQKTKFLSSLFVILFVFLFSFRFTYWQDTGLGDNNRIPIGYDQTIENEDFENTYFQPTENATSIVVNKYSIVNTMLYAEIHHDFSKSSKFDYFSFNLKTKVLKKFTREKYIVFAKENNVPLPDTFISFRIHFETYLNNRPFWRKWLIP